MYCVWLRGGVGTQSYLPRNPVFLKLRSSILRTQFEKGYSIPKASIYLIHCEITFVKRRTEEAHRTLHQTLFLLVRSLLDGSLFLKIVRRESF